MESSNGAARDSNSLDEWFARGAVSVVVGAPDLGHNEAATTSSNHAEASATNSGGGMNGDQGKSTRRVSLGVGRFDSDANVHLVADNALPAAPEAEEPSRQVSWSNAKTQEMEGQPAQDEEAASSDGSHSWTCDDFNDHGARQTSTGLTRRAGRSLSLQSESMEDYKLQRSHRRRSAWKFEAHELPESTYTWLITENIASRPFVVGLVAMGLSVTSLALVLINQLGNRSDMSPYGLPAGVNVEVRIAQYIGVLIGVLMEEEVPMGLDLIGQYAEQRMLGRNPYHPSKLALSCLARMAVGYLFLACLFFAVLQSSDVLDIFFDVLALEFVERMDDVIFQLSKRGLFGKKLRIAAYEKHVFEAPGDAKTEGCARWMKRLTGTVYFLNTALMIAGLTILTSNQNQGIYRCNSISIAFFDDVWEGAYVKLPDGTMQQRLLVCELDEDFHCIMC
uniref:Uncharacterized protein n=1 Tax=Pseudictyota dubia TaxID=2749911 RepID=A0A7R9ZJ37_9STRA|mmetsp:Transcript_7873/g.14280  ORF Transcript_7873/g.14280 Transcript_7873/m.14280 type:complete len:449 (+) Transcript_7873:127-1473(+)